MRSLKKASQSEAIGQSFACRWLRKRLVLNQRQAFTAPAPHFSAKNSAKKSCSSTGLTNSEKDGRQRAFGGLFGGTLGDGDSRTKT